MRVARIWALKAKSKAKSLATVTIPKKIQNEVVLNEEAVGGQKISVLLFKI